MFSHAKWYLVLSHPSTRLQPAHQKTSELPTTIWRENQDCKNDKLNVG